MNNSIEIALKSLTETVLSEVQAANAETEVAKSRYAGLVNRILALVADLPIPANDISDPDHGPFGPSVVTPVKRAGSSACSDTAFLDALTHEWIGAGKLHKLLTARGFKIAEGTVYNRMRKLSAERPDEIEAGEKPERWRLKSHAPVAEAESNIEATKPRQRRAATPQLSVVPASVSAANDDPVEVHMPTLLQGDCLDVMKSIPDASIDLILADLPYGTTRLDIDVRVPMESVWQEYRRIIKPRGNIALFASQPFTTDLINAARDLFKYDLVWEKPIATGVMHARNKPLKAHEDILIFTPGTTIHENQSPRRATYYPHGATATTKPKKAVKNANYLKNPGIAKIREGSYEALTNCPRSVMYFAKDRTPRGIEAHPFAKPVALLEQLIQTYSNAGDVVLDNTMGSGSTCVAAMRTGRNSIGIELNTRWFDFAKARIHWTYGELRNAPRALDCSIDAEREAA